MDAAGALVEVAAAVGGVEEAWLPCPVGVAAGVMGVVDEVSAPALAEDVAAGGVEVGVPVGGMVELDPTVRTAWAGSLGGVAAVPPA